VDFWDALHIYSLDQSFEKEKGDPTLNYSFIILLTALEIAHGETHRWRAGSADRL